MAPDARLSMLAPRGRIYVCSRSSSCHIRWSNRGILHRARPITNVSLEVRQPVGTRCVHTRVDAREESIYVSYAELNGAKLLINAGP
jgi:hypothetical protein